MLPSLQLIEESINQDSNILHNHLLHQIDCTKDECGAFIWNFISKTGETTGFDLEYEPEQSITFNQTESIAKVDLYADEVCLFGLVFFDSQDKTIATIGDTTDPKLFKTTIKLASNQQILGVIGKAIDGAIV